MGRFYVAPVEPILVPETFAVQINTYWIINNMCFAQIEVDLYLLYFLLNYLYCRKYLFIFNFPYIIDLAFEKEKIYF